MKKIIIMMMLFAPMSIFAQKFGHVDSQAILQTLPDIAKVNGELQAISQEKENALQAMQRTVHTYNINPSNDILFTTKNKAEFEEKKLQAQQEKLQPIYTKIHTAIDNVGKAGNYTYIFDAQAMVFVGNDAKDITADVKAELAKMK